MALITPPFAAPVSGRGAADLLRLGRSEGAAALGIVAAVETTLSAGGPERANQPNSTQRPMVIPANHRGGPENPQNF